MERIDDITILIPVRDDRRVAACIASMDVACPVLLVLNGATSEFERWVRAACPTAKAVTTPRAGLGHAYNVGLDACASEYALLMDSDCIFGAGTIAKLRAGLERAALSKGRVVFSHHNIITRAIAAYRAFHTSDWVNAYSPPLALSRSIVKSFLGNFFDEDLTWSEDLDFDHRVTRAGLHIAYDAGAVITHPALSLRGDLRAAFNYGVGYAVGARKGLFPTPASKKMSDYLKLYTEHFRRVNAAKGLVAAVYALAWLRAHRAGYRSEARA